MKRYPLADDTWSTAENAAIQRVVESGRHTLGPEVARLEEQFASYFGARHCVMVNSGSSANLIMVAALVYSGRIAPGAEVIVPAVSWSTSYYPFSQFGLTLRFVDVDSATFNMNIEAVRGAIKSQTRAILAVNLLGNPNDFSSLRAICEEHDLILLEDNCESMGATLDGCYTGTFGTMGTFSSFFSHHISTMEGGYVITDDEELFHYLLAIRAHGWTRNLPSQSRIHRKHQDPFYESFNFIVPGFNVRPLEIEGAIGQVQLEKLAGFIEQRQKNAALFQKDAERIPTIRIQREFGTSSWFGFAIVLEQSSPVTRDVVVTALTDAGIETRPIVTGNFTRNPVIRYLPHEIDGPLSVADQLHDNGFFVGNHSSDIGDEIEHLFEILVRTLGQ